MALRLDGESQASIAARIRFVEREPQLKRWLLFVKRGTARYHIIRDGVLFEPRYGPSRPEPNGAIYLLFDWHGLPPHGYSDDAANEKHLCRLVANGLFNVVSSEARAGIIEDRIKPAFWE